MEEKNLLIFSPMSEKLGTFKEKFEEQDNASVYEIADTNEHLQVIGILESSLTISTDYKKYHEYLKNNKSKPSLKHKTIFLVKNIPPSHLQNNVRKNCVCEFLSENIEIQELEEKVNSFFDGTDESAFDLNMDLKKDKFNLELKTKTNTTIIDTDSKQRVEKGLLAEDGTKGIKNIDLKGKFQLTDHPWNKNRIKKFREVQSQLEKKNYKALKRYQSDIEETRSLREKEEQSQRKNETRKLHEYESSKDVKNQETNKEEKELEKKSHLSLHDYDSPGLEEKGKFHEYEQQKKEGKSRQKEESEENKKNKILNIYETDNEKEKTKQNIENDKQDKRNTQLHEYASSEKKKNASLKVYDSDNKNPSKKLKAKESSLMVSYSNYQEPPIDKFYRMAPPKEDKDQTKKTKNDLSLEEQEKIKAIEEYINLVDNAPEDIKKSYKKREELEEEQVQEVSDPLLLEERYFYEGQTAKLDAASFIQDFLLNPLTQKIHILKYLDFFCQIFYKARSQFWLAEDKITLIYPQISDIESPSIDYEQITVPTWDDPSFEISQNQFHFPIYENQQIRGHASFFFNEHTIQNHKDAQSFEGVILLSRCAFLKGDN